jgi:hypothetical protein
MGNCGRRRRGMTHEVIAREALARVHEADLRERELLREVGACGSGWRSWRLLALDTRSFEGSR